MTKAVAHTIPPSRRVPEGKLPHGVLPAIVVQLECPGPYCYTKDIEVKPVICVTQTGGGGYVKLNQEQGAALARILTKIFL